MKKFGALFDLDGVLIDSESRYTVFWESMEREFPTGIPDYARAIKGSTLEAIIGNYPEHQRAEIIDRLMQFQSNMVYELYPGVLEFLDSLAAEGIRSAIVTSSDPHKMEVLFRQIPALRRRFACVVDGSMVTHSKPHPEGYLLAARMIGMDPADCCVFEDSLQGLRAGRAAGGKVVGLSTTYGRELVEPLADITVGALAELTPQSVADLWT